MYKRLIIKYSIIIVIVLAGAVSMYFYVKTSAKNFNKMLADTVEKIETADIESTTVDLAGSRWNYKLYMSIPDFAEGSRGIFKGDYKGVLSFEQTEGNMCKAVYEDDDSSYHKWFGLPSFYTKMEPAFKKIEELPCELDELELTLGADNTYTMLSYDADFSRIEKISPESYAFVMNARWAGMDKFNMTCNALAVTEDMLAYKCSFVEFELLSYVFVAERLK